MLAPTFSYLNDVYLAFGVAAKLPEILERHGIRRPLVVTDAGLVRLGYVDRLGLKDPAVFDAVQTNPTEASCRAGLARFREAGCDGLVALGGGSPIDLAKCVALGAHHEGPLESFSIGAGGMARITGRVPPLLAIPTTAGSGSEVGRAALLTLDDGRKLGFISPHLLPKAALCDPELTFDLPPLLTAATGMDALSHAVETFLSPRENPAADALALEGLRFGYAHIRHAVGDGRDREARRAMMLCSVLSGLAFPKSLGAVHSLSHPLGGLTAKKLHHGTLNALFLPHVLRFNADHCAEKMLRLAQTLGLANAAALPETFSKLCAELGLPSRLRDMGVTREDLEPLAERALKDHCTPTNPRRLDLEACQRLYREAW